MISICICSVGSLGENGAYETVEDVYVKNCTFNGTQNGARIKTYQVKMLLNTNLKGLLCFYLILPHFVF